MSVRKRTWKRAKDRTECTAWQVDYRDGAGKRRSKQFDRKKDADAWAARTTVDVANGIHVADAATVTVEEAGRLWIETGKAQNRERTTLNQRRQHLEIHIVPFIGSLKLNKISVPSVRAFQDQLREAGTSPIMIKRVTTSLSGILQDAQERGLVAQNAIRGMRKSGSEKRHEKRLEVGFDIPTPQEMAALIAAIPPRWRPLLLTAIFTGMRASELRGLRWQDVDIQGARVHVRQRADCYKHIGMPKSRSSQRAIPLPPIVVNTLREWQLRCPKGDLGLVFPNTLGRVERYDNIIEGGLLPALRAAGLTDGEGRPKYTGLHMLRHWFASWCINRKADGGRELNPKAVQQLLGHSSITMTLDRYGHLFPSTDDNAELEAATAMLLRAT